MKHKFGLFSLSFLVSSTAFAIPTTDNSKSELQTSDTSSETTVTPKRRAVGMPSLAGYSNLLHSNYKIHNRANKRVNNPNLRNVYYSKSQNLMQKQDTLKRLTAVASNSMSNFSQSGLASWYGRNQNGKKTASGEILDINAMTAAHHTLKLGSYVKVTNKRNGKSVVVKINDRMPTSNKRVIDVSYAVAKEIGMASQGAGNITIERINKPRHSL